MRSTLEKAPKPPPTSLIRCWLSRYWRFAWPHRSPIRPTMPMAVSASALRRLASARELRAPANRLASRLGAVVNNSVSTVSTTSTTAPAKAV
jgi:hypothetical protein